MEGCWCWLLAAGASPRLCLLFGIDYRAAPADTFHRPTHLFLAAMFPDICRKVWRPLVEAWLTSFCRVWRLRALPARAVVWHWCAWSAVCRCPSVYDMSSCCSCTQKMKLGLQAACSVFKGLETYCGKSDKDSFKLAKDVASWITPAALMKGVGQLEVWCGMLMLISLAGTGSR